MSSVPSRRIPKLMLLGAAGFWLPDTLLHAVPRNGIVNWHDVRILTTVMPLTFLGTFLATRWLQKGATPKRIGLPMLAGVWLLGGLFMMIGASFLGGGFVMSDGAYWIGLLALLSLLPMYTFVMATYDGSQFALMLVTTVAFLVWLIQLRRMPLSSRNKSPSPRKFAA